MATFKSPIDNKEYSTEWSGGAKTRLVNNPVYDAYLKGQTANESFNPASMFSGWTGALTNAPGEALTYANGLNDPNYTDPGWVQNESFNGPTNPNFKTQVEMADPEYERWMSHYWAYLHPEEYARRQAEQAGGGGLFDMAKGLASSDIMLPLYAAGAAYLGGLGGLGEAGGAISAADASAAMGSGVDAAGWGSGALDSLGAATAAPSWAGGNYAWPSVGGEGLQGIATGALDGTAGALGSTSGAAGLTGTIEGLGTLTAEGMLIPAAGGAAVPLSSLTSGLPSLSDLKSLLDKAKEVKSGVSAVTTALGGGATAPKTTKPATANAGAFSGMYPVSQGKSALEAMMSGEDSNSLDEFMRLMAQSGKGA